VKILHLANFYHAQSGGIRTYLDRKRQYFATRGLPFRLLIPGEIDGADEGADGAIIYRLGAPAAPINPLYRLIWNFPAVFQIVRRERPDLIEVNDKYTLAFVAYVFRKLLKSMPTVGFHHERLDASMVTYFGDSPLVRRIARLGMRAAVSAFDRIICASRYTAEEILPIAPERVSIVNLGVDLEQFSPDRADAALRARLLRNEELLLLYVGRLAREKNLGLLPLLLDLLRTRGLHARLVVAGSGPDEDMLQAREHDDITLLGFVQERDEMARLMASADLLVFPSEREPYGLVPLEALASGTPVVCSREGGVTEYCDSPAVVSLAPTAERFAAAIADLVTAGEHALLRVPARRQAERFSWAATFERQLDLYEEVLRGRSNGGLR
jgi:alpha-1,6-mannosyltransferase